MRLLLDQGLPRSAVLHLKNADIEAAHVGDRGLASASDSRMAGLWSPWTPIFTRHDNHHRLFQVYG